jgi:hypothetical protein
MDIWKITVAPVEAASLLQKLLAVSGFTQFDLSQNFLLFDGQLCNFGFSEHTFQLFPFLESINH